MMRANQTNVFQREKKYFISVVRFVATDFCHKKKSRTNVGLTKVSWK